MPVYWNQRGKKKPAKFKQKKYVSQVEEMKRKGCPSGEKKKFIKKRKNIRIWEFP